MSNDVADAKLDQAIARMDQTIAKAYRRRHLTRIYKQLRTLLRCHVWPGHSFCQGHIEGGEMKWRCSGCGNLSEALTNARWIKLAIGLAFVGAVVASVSTALHLGTVIAGEIGCLAGITYSGIFFWRLR
jgi:hypothetical protein